MVVPGVIWQDKMQILSGGFQIYPMLRKKYATGCQNLGTGQGLTWSLIYSVK